VVGLSVVLVATTFVAAACRSDGRTMRPARPDQDATVSTTIATTVPQLPAGEVPDGGLDLPVVSTLPAPTGVPTSVAATPSTSAVVPTTRGGAGGVGATTTDAAHEEHDEFAERRLTAPWASGGEIGIEFTCDGDDVSPAVSWTPAPEGTVEIAITVTDADAPEFVHWAVAAIDPLSTALGEGRVPEFATQALNSSGTAGYAGPCPPAGETHTYLYTVSFLGQQTEVTDGSPGGELLAEIRAKAFDSVSVSGTYSRP